MDAKSSQSAEIPTLAWVVNQTLAFSLLNPHVYLDTVVLIGGYSTRFEALQTRALFGLGAMSFSAIWFFGLSFSAAALSKRLNNTQTMRKISVVSGVILLGLALKLGQEVWRWCF